MWWLVTKWVFDICGTSTHVRGLTHVLVRDMGGSMHVVVRHKVVLRLMWWFEACSWFMLRHMCLSDTCGGWTQSGPRLERYLALIWVTCIADEASGAAQLKCNLLGVRYLIWYTCDDSLKVYEATLADSMTTKQAEAAARKFASGSLVLEVRSHSSVWECLGSEEISVGQVRL